MSITRLWRVSAMQEIVFIFQTNKCCVLQLTCHPVVLCHCYIDHSTHCTASVTVLHKYLECYLSNNLHTYVFWDDDVDVSVTPVSLVVAYCADHNRDRIASCVLC